MWFSALKNQVFLVKSQKAKMTGNGRKCPNMVGLRFFCKIASLDLAEIGVTFNTSSALIFTKATYTVGS